MPDNVLAPHGINAIAWLFVRQAVRSLPTDQQARYREEFCAELTEMTGIQQAVHAWRLLRSSAMLAYEHTTRPTALYRTGRAPVARRAGE